MHVFKQLTIRPFTIVKDNNASMFPIYFRTCTSVMETAEIIIEMSLTGSVMFLIWEMGADMAKGQGKPAMTHRNAQ